jgi:CHAT domain-containing protein
MINQWIVAFGRAAFRLALPVIAFSAALSGQQVGPVRLELGRAIRGELATQQTHSFAVALKAGQYMRLVVSQPRFSTVLRLFAPDGIQKLVELNLTGAGRRPEPMCWIAESPGEYHVELAGSQAEDSDQYEIQLAELREAVAADRKRVTAQQRFEQARELAAKLEFAKAIEAWEQAVVLVRETKDRERESAALSGIGSMNSKLYQYEAAIGYYEQALVICREIKDRKGEGLALNDLGNIYRNLSQPEKAIGYYEQALAICREIKSRQGEGRNLICLGNAYLDLSQHEKAIGYYDQALVICRETKNRQDEWASLNNLANAYGNLNQYERAIEYYEQALMISREIKDRMNEGLTLNDLGTVYTNLSQHEKAIGYYEQALEISREVKDRGGEGITLNNLGEAYRALNRYERAIEYCMQALLIVREVKDRSGEGETLNNLGEAYWGLKQYGKAIEYHKQALDIRREIKDRYGEGTTLSDLGAAYRGLSQYEAAIGYYKQALLISREVRSRDVEAANLDGLMTSWKASGNPRLAIFYGKQAVNAIQSIRTDIRGLGSDLQQSYLKGNERPYHTLAELLISQGRLAEAEQVLNLLKEQEYFEFIRRKTNEGSSLNRRADLTAEEAELDNRRREVEDRLVAIGSERGELLLKKTLSTEEEQRLARIDSDLEAANAVYGKFLSDLEAHFSSVPEARVRVEQLKGAQALMEDLRDLPTGTVAIYTLVGDDKCHTILVTPDVRKAYAYPISAADLNRKLLAFRQVVQNPNLDPRPLANELYRILVANMEDDLRQAKAKTLMWSLDGALRYLPIAALFDGKQYLIEQYNVSVFTPASNARLKDQPDHRWTAAGFGVTKEHEGAPALPEVASELSGIISDKAGSKGVLDGSIQMDEAFTEESFRAELRKKAPVIHIASHFTFHPGDDTSSFLTMGDGSRLTLSRLKNLPNLFGGVQLLTLSACNTGMGGSSADGKEVEGFGALAQNQGAKAVVASLWSVADASTSRLMQEFYRIREASTGITKLEALRQAQLELLRGKVQLNQPSAPNRGVVLYRDDKDVEAKTLADTPRFQFNPQAPYAHPYYWAPFFLMGNWL